MVTAKGDLAQRLQGFHIVGVSTYNGKRQMENRLTGAFVPDWRTSDFDSAAESLLLDYMTVYGKGDIEVKFKDGTVIAVK